MFVRFRTLFVLALVAATVAQGNDPVTAGTQDMSYRMGADLKLLVPPNIYQLLFGWRFSFNASDAFSVGGAAYTGQTTGGDTGSFSYGGVTVGYNLRFSQSFRLEFDLLAGGGGGFRAAGGTLGGMIIEPSIALAFSLGKNVGSALHVGYLWMPTSTAGTGISGGLRFEFF